MPDRLTDSSPTEQIDAVATLMLHCGISVDMNYSPTGSSAAAYKIKEALMEYFKYDLGMKTYEEKVMPEDIRWENLLKSEIINKRPVVYVGYSDAGGHAFVCDGYDNNGFFHFNWGWGGGSDGYFQITDLHGFNNYNSFIYGIKKEEWIVLLNVIVKAYQHANFKGGKVELAGNCENLKEYGFNDKISSIKVAEGYKCKAWQHANYKGNWRIYEGKISYLEGFNDTISSIEVIKIS